ncbi:restriction endonuclease subunit S [Bacillus toyonensis]|uniref:restriction endonuclease subunit S n=1 Tax=Bacillus toyonensis TaxID=155322 RepID=UPI0030174A99
MSSTQHWKKIKLKYLADMRSGESITSDVIEPTGLYPVYGGGALRGYTSEYTHEGKYVLIGRQGAHCGNVKTVQGKFWASEHAVVVTPSSIVDIDWLGYLLESMNLNQYSMSAAQPGLAVSMIKNLEVLCPAKNIQEKITKYINTKVTSIEELIKQKEKLIQLIEEKRQSMITEVVTKGLNPNVKMKDSGVEWVGEIPFNYKTMKLKHLVETKITDGPHETPVLCEEGVPFISAEAIKSGKVDFNYMRGFISVEDHKKFSKKCFPKYGDIFMVKSGATTGKIGIVDTNEEFSIWSPLALIRANKEKILNGFLYYYMQSDIFQKQVQLGWNYGTQQNIGMGVIENLLIICPPVDIQNILLEKIESESKNIDTLKEELNIQIQKLKDYRQSLIYGGVTGKIDVRDFEIESE